MPIYEYLCSKCRKKFETLSLSTTPELPSCPRCGENAVERVFSRFAAVGTSKSQSDDFSDGSLGEDPDGGEWGSGDDASWGEGEDAEDSYGDEGGVEDL